ncbi:MAG: hypothetical protein K2Q25_09950 [Mycobacteriaceae bacterium]|nr:hypothetical protein [Mycobacteriaceae bacterium]
MSVVGGAVRTVGRTVGRAATTTTMAAGAVGGAAVDGVVGAVKGAAAGIRHGADAGSHSTPAAALTLTALGVSGLVQWPVLLVVGGTALAWRQLNRRHDSAATAVGATAKSPRLAKSVNSAQPKTPKAPAKTSSRQAPGRSRETQSHSDN